MDAASATPTAHCSDVLKQLNEDRKGAQLFCDATLKVEDAKFPVHRCVLGMVSAYFHNLFSSELKEKYIDELVLTNTTECRVALVLEFVYTGQVPPIDTDSVFDVLEDSEYMQLAGLKCACEELLLREADAENCLKLRAYARRYQLVEVGRKTTALVQQNFGEVLRHDDFCRVTVDDALEILDLRSKEVPADAIYYAVVNWTKRNEPEDDNVFPRLFGKVDIGFLPKAFLRNVVVNEQLVTSSPTCMKILLDAFLDVGPNVVSDPSRLILLGGLGTEGECAVCSVNGVEQNLAPMLERRVGLTAVMEEQRVVAMGGGWDLNMVNALSSVEELGCGGGGEDPEEWRSLSPMCEARHYAASAILNGYIYVTGGGNQSGYLSSCERFDPASEKWSQISSMSIERAYHGAAVLRGQLYCVGGCNSKAHLSSVVCFDPVRCLWEEVNPLNVARSGLAIVAHKDRIYAIGGYNGDALSTVERYNPESKQWCQLQSLSLARNRPIACVLDGKLSVIGGQDVNRADVRTVEVYNPVEDTWKSCKASNITRYSSACVT